MVHQTRSEERAIVLMATLSAAAEVVHGMMERREGRDPAGQEDPAEAGAWLRSAVAEIEEYLQSLQAAIVIGEKVAEDEPYSLSRRMTVVMLLQQLSRLLHVTHQRMLSLYPQVAEDIIEETRLVQAECARMCEGWSEGMENFLVRAHRLCRSIRVELP